MDAGPQDRGGCVEARGALGQWVRSPVTSDGSGWGHAPAAMRCAGTPIMAPEGPSPPQRCPLASPEVWLWGSPSCHSLLPNPQPQSKAVRGLSSSLSLAVL